METRFTAYLQSSFERNVALGHAQETSSLLTFLNYADVTLSSSTCFAFTAKSKNVEPANVSELLSTYLLLLFLVCQRPI